MSTPSEQTAHFTTEPLPQSQAAWVQECKADFRESGLREPIVHEYDGQELSVRQFRALYEYWSGFPKLGGAPVIEKIDPLGFKEALGDVMLLEPIAGETDFRYRIFGTVVTERLGYDMTGRRTSEIVGIDPITKFLMRSYQAVVDERRAYLAMHFLPDYVATEDWRRLILPVSNPEGEIDRLLVGNLAGELRVVSNDPSGM